MRRHFLRIYLGIAAVLFLAAAATLLVANRTLEEIHRENARQRAIATASTVRDALSEAGDSRTRERILSALQATRRLRFERWTSAEGRLSAAEWQRLEAGETIGTEAEEGLVAVTLLRDGQVLAITFLRPPDRLSPDFLFLAVLAGTLALVGVAFFLLVKPLERRIGALSATAERLGAGDLTARAAVEGADSIAELAATLNGMAERISRLVEGQRELLRGVSHELRTPLARLFFMLDDAQGAATAEEKDDVLERIQGSLSDLNDLVEELLTFVRLDGNAAPPALEKIDVPSVCKEMRRVVADLKEDFTVEVDCPPVEMMGFPRYFRRAVLNLVTNAARHARQRVRIACAVDGPDVRITVDDDGAGVPEHDRERIFEPFYRVDESRNSSIGGSGLGLAIVQRIVRLHGGKVVVGSSSMGGARFTLMLPGTSSHLCEGSAPLQEQAPQSPGPDLPGRP